MTQGAQNVQVETAEIYRQQYAHFGRMNDILYKLPAFYSTIMGGLWYFAANYAEKDRIISFAIFVFAAFICRTFANMTKRFGRAFKAYINNINKLDREYAISISDPNEKSSIRSIQTGLYAAMIISISGALYVAWPFIVSITNLFSLCHQG